MSARARGPVAVVCAAAFLASSAGTSRSDAAAASDCTPQVTRTALGSFVAAFNRGAYRRLDALFAQPPRFGWYSSNPPGLRRGSSAHDRGSLIAYFRSRHSNRDRLRLTAFTFTGNARGYGNLTFELRRSAADYRRGAWFGLIGKGAAACSAPPGTAQFVVLSLGGPGSEK